MREAGLQQYNWVWYDSIALGESPRARCLSGAHACPKIEQRGSRNTGESQVVTVCSQCEKAEPECSCVKYCCFCQSQYNIHMGVDGLYYCPDCREACDVRLADTDGH